MTSATGDALRPRLGRARRRVGRRSLRRPRVTVIIPTYNWSTVLPHSIGSVLDQTMADLELWVVGDGCTDDSEAVVREVGDDRVRWHNLTANTGNQAAPNNEGLRHARGELVAYLGHDDLWLPHHLELLASAIDAGAAFAFGHQLRIDPGREPYVWPPPGWRYAPGEWVPPTATVHRRDDARRVGGWRGPIESGRLDPEADLWDRVARAVGPPAMLQTVSSVKLPASRREGVYRERPCDEQATWLTRIRDDPDAEHFVQEALTGPGAPARYDADAVPAPLVDAPASITALERHRLRRRFKGLD